MKLFFKLAGVLFTFILLLLPFAALPKPAAAQTGCQLIVSTTEVVAHGSFNVTVQNGQPGIEYIISYDSSINNTIFTMPASGSFTAAINLDYIFGASSPQASSGSFLVAAGTTLALGFPGAEGCSPTSGITITVIAPPLPTALISADSTNIPYNTSTNLNWTSTNADTCTLNGSSVATSDTKSTGNLTANTTFTLVCTNVSGTATASVTVNVALPPPPTCSPPNQTVTTGVNANFTASAGSGTFTWSAPGGTSASGSGSSFATSYSTTGTKTVTVTSAGQQASCAVTVTAPTPIITITAESTSIAYNTSTTIRWTSQNATSCTLNGSSVALNDSQSTGNITQTTTYTLKCQGSGGATQKSVTVTVAAPLACSYTFSPTTVDSGGTVTVTITAGGASDKFMAEIVASDGSGKVFGSQPNRTGPGTLTLTAPTVTITTTFVVAAFDISVSPSQQCSTASSSLTVNPPPLKWHMSQPIVVSNQLSVLFSFTPASNGNIGLIVAPQSSGNCNWDVLPRPFDSGAIADGTGQVTWYFPPPGSYCAELVFGTEVVSDNPYVTFTIQPPPATTWQLSLNNCSGYTAYLNISPAAGGSSVLHINELKKEVPITQGATNITWAAPSNPATYTAEIIYWGVRVSNPVNLAFPCNPPATQWTLTYKVTSGNDVTFTVLCPTKDCPGSGGGDVPAAVNIKNTDTNGPAGSIPVPAGGGTLPPITLPNGNYSVEVDAGLKQVGGPVEFTLPQKTNCGFIIFPGGAGVVVGPVNNCALQSPTGVISAILPYVFGVAAFLSIIVIVISGIQFITSSGNPEAAAAARNRLVFALIGLAIIILAFAILQIIDRLFLGGSGVS